MAERFYRVPSIPVYEVKMKLSLRGLTFTLSLLLAPVAFSSVSHEIPYYGSEFYKNLDQGLKEQNLEIALHQILTADHIRHANAPDEITANCSGKDCYGHRTVGYSKAKQFVLGHFYLVNHAGGWAIRDVYCEKDFGSESFNGTEPGPNKIPDSTVVNVEHTWPQSKFTRKYPEDFQKADLHHLFPTDSQMNSTRSNLPFGEIGETKKDLKCPISRFGITTEGRELAFEPPTAHKGNVARALFYFAVRYDMKIDATQETYLKKWHREDPVDAQEIARNEEILALQGNRNPFIDHPELVDLIGDF
jgi:deoxyribonuclease-1